MVEDKYILTYSGLAYYDERIKDYLKGIIKNINNIDDSIVASGSTWSSEKIVSELADAGFSVQIVDELPESGDTHVIYFLPVTEPISGNTYDEFMWINNSWEQIGSTDIDLSDYYNVAEVNALLDLKQNLLAAGDNIEMFPGVSGETIICARGYTYDTEKDSFAEGDGTFAMGTSSHAEGRDTIAHGNYSHAEGRDTIAHGNYSHAEGSNTTASGSSSHAEGYLTVASGSCTHAEGQGTKASGDYSHAEGSSTVASGICSHAEGNITTASGYYSHAEGCDTEARGYSSHAEGVSTVAIGAQSHAEGVGSIASGYTSHAEGSGTTASGSYSHAEGNGTTASGDYSHAEGKQTVAYSKNSHVEGIYDMDSIGGQWEYDDNSTVIREHGGSGGMSDISVNQIVIVKDGDEYVYRKVVSVGETSFTVDEAIVHGETEAYLGTVLGGIAYGKDSHAEGLSNAIGEKSHSEGHYSDAIGKYSHAEGDNTTASFTAAHAEGGNTVASNYGAHAEGENTVASGPDSHAGGLGTVAGGIATTAIGMYNKTSGYPGSGTLFVIGNGVDSAHTSDAMVVDSSSNITISGGLKKATGGSSTTVWATNGGTATLPTNTNTWRPIKVNDGNFLTDTSTSLNLSAGTNITLTTGSTGLITISATGGGAGTDEKVKQSTGNTDAGFPILVSAVQNPSGTAQEALYDTGFKINPNKHSIMEGSGTIASGFYSHAEGSGTTASGSYSHAEGVLTEASGDYSHVEGSGCTASENGAHAEGGGCKALGIDSHAEGHGCQAGTHSHAEGWCTTADYRCHAEGCGTTASGIYSHAEGYNTTASGTCTHAEGSNTTASGNCTHAEGASTTASGDYSHAEGYGTKASGSCAHAEGFGTTAMGNFSHAAGYYTSANTENSYVIGRYNSDCASGELFTVGNGTGAGGRNSGFKIVDDNGGSFGGNVTVTVLGNVNASDGFFDTSDIRKKNIKKELDLDRCYDLIEKCSTVIYELKDDEEHKEQIGLIAQEVQEFFPEVIKEDNDGFLSLDYAKLTVICFRVLKDLINEVKKLKDNK